MHRSRFALALRCSSLAALGACGGEPGESAPAAKVGEAVPVQEGWPVTVERTGAERHEYDRVVLVTIDTLRADHVSCYGYPRATTPFLDSMAERGARFARAMAAVSHTAPSHATMLTGLVPAVHGVFHNGEELDREAVDLGGLFAAAGYETAAFLNVQFLTGITGSFGHVEVRRVGKLRGNDGADVVDAALGWLEGQRTSARFFLWVHLYDPHEWQLFLHLNRERAEPSWSGATPEGFLAHLLELHGLPEPEPEKPYAVDWGADRSLEDPSLATFLRAIDEYDERTLFADRQVERLYQRIDALGLAGRTLWVVTSDHGEGLASHRTSGHGLRIYQEQLHVPLVVHASDGSLPARVVEELVAHEDLLPTLAETLGLCVSGRAGLYEGRSLWPLMRAEPAAWPERAVFSQRRTPRDASDPDQSELYALQTARAKLILRRTGPGAAEVHEFFDLARDPRELEDLGAGDARAAELRAALDERLRSYGRLTAAGEEESVPEDVLQELRELGYAR